MILKFSEFEIRQIDNAGKRILFKGVSNVATVQGKKYGKKEKVNLITTFFLTDLEWSR